MLSSFWQLLLFLSSVEGTSEPRIPILLRPATVLLASYRVHRHTARDMEIIQNNNISKIAEAAAEAAVAATNSPTFPPERMVEYLGVVNYATTERVIEEIKDLMREDALSPIYLLVTSAGGPTGTAMSFYDSMRLLLKPRLVTIGSGDVDSSGVLIFLAGEQRFITKHTTLLLHLAGRSFESGKRYTAAEVEAMFKEDTLKDRQYASVVAENSRGKLTTDDVLALMSENTILSAEDMVAYGLAERVLG